MNPGSSNVSLRCCSTVTRPSARLDRTDGCSHLFGEPVAYPAFKEHCGQLWKVTELHDKPTSPWAKPDYTDRGPACQVLRRRCREHMICPLPRASEMSAFRAVQATAMVSKGGDHGLRRGRGGAGDESPRGHHAAVEWSTELPAAGGHPRDRSPQPPPLPPPLSTP